jgi:hypothetical protein
MKRLLLVLILVMAITPVATMADDYTKLWKEHQTACENDLPQTAIKVLDRIEKKATREESYGQLLKARLKRIVTEMMISPDSLDVELERIEESEREARDVNPVLASVYECVLGKVYKNLESRTGSQASKIKSQEYFAQSLSRPELLASVRADGYEPMVMSGVDSRLFDNDLLHVLGMEADAWDVLHDWYEKHGNRAATCYCALKLLETGEQKERKELLARLDSLVARYGDLPVCGEVAIRRYELMNSSEFSRIRRERTNDTRRSFVEYIDWALTKWGDVWPRMTELKAARQQFTCPSFRARINEGISLPGHERKVYVNGVVNLKSLTMTVTRLNVDGTCSLDPNYDNDYKKLQSKLDPKGPVQKVTRSFDGHEDWESLEDSIVIKGLPLGVYLVEFKGEKGKDNSGSALPVRRSLLHVSNLFLMSEALPKNQIRYTVVDAIEGQPVPKAKLVLKFSPSLRTAGKPTAENKRKEVTLDLDAKGEAIYTYEKNNRPELVYVYTAEDKAYPEQNGYTYYYRDNVVQGNTQVAILTDRSIYRPGQTVKAKMVAYQTRGHGVARVVAGSRLKVRLRDANYKDLESKDVVTDEFGSASAEFVLPTVCLTGEFSLYTEGGSTSFSVEEYKRPTFKVEFDPITEKYDWGDTLDVKGMVKSFAGVPVQGANAKYRVVRRSAWHWWYRPANSSPDTELLTGEAVTDDAGEFKVPVPLVKEILTTEELGNGGKFYVFDVLVDVTDMSGESHHGETSVPLGFSATTLGVRVPEMMLTDSEQSIAFSYLNSAGKEIEGNITYYINATLPSSTSGKKVGEWTVKANEPVKLDMKKLKSGRYTLVAKCGKDEVEAKFVVFSMEDKRPVVDTHDWFYATGDEFPRDGGSVKVQFGSSDENQHVVYSLLSGDKVLEDGTLDQSNALTTREFKYKEEYGDGVLFTCAWVRDGELYAHSQRIAKPFPDKTLHLKWTTFRDKLTPGQKEEWTLTITDSKEKPVKAQLLAAMFDRSLDDIRMHSWPFYLNLLRSLPWTNWVGGYSDAFYLSSEMRLKALEIPELSFSHFDESLFYITPGLRVKYTSPVLIGARGNVAIQMAKVASINGDHELGGERMATKDVMGDDSELKKRKEPEDNSRKNNGENDVLQMRENFSETAFFYPSLTSDEKGQVKIHFTLPESVTTWRFMGFAHDKDVRYGSIEGEVVAKKTVMVQPNMPRFLRVGDVGKISARIFNTSEHTVSGVSTIELLEAETEEVVYKQEMPFSIEAGKGTSVAFNVNANNLPSLLICRIKAEGAGFGDGEQHYLPVLTNEELVTTTVPFTQNGAGVKTIDLGNLFPTTISAPNGSLPKLTIEYTNHPAWLMIQALPTMANPNTKDAISLATAIYANSISSYLVRQSPEIEKMVKLWQMEETGIGNQASGDKKRETSLMSSLQKNEELKSILLDETPWVMDADHEADQKRQLVNLFDTNQMEYRLNDFQTKLKELQNADGSFSWWPGMPGNPYTTMSVAETLVRLNHALGKQDDTSSLLSDALTYLDSKIHDDVVELKKLQRKGSKNLMPSELDISYLYIRSLDDSGLKNTNRSDIEYLVNLLAKHPADLTLYGKAITAIIMAKNHRTAEAKNLLQSIREYSVYTEEMGRYFDSPKAYYSWFDYKIPTEVAAIEAIRELTNDEKTIEEMQRWLLQSKRTQCWDTPINAVNAVYAFLNGETNKLSTTGQMPATLKVDGSIVETPQATAGLGYVKTSLAGGHHKTFTAEKTSSGTSWGALYAQYMQKATNAGNASSGLTVKREVIKEMNGEKIDVVDNGGALKVGDKVRIRLTIQADRDYDFVQVQDKRAACLEPIRQLSGYHNGCYQAPRDHSTYFYFDRMAKGTHIVETEYFVDREGTYQMGICTVQCAYSPEYSARTGALTMTIGN